MNDVPNNRRELVDTPLVPARSPTERWLTEVWAQILKLDEVGIEDHFMELGGDSMAAIQFVTELETRLGIEIPAWEIFEKPTIAAIAAQLPTTV